MLAVKKSQVRTGEIAQHLIVLVALTEDPGSTTRTHIVIPENPEPSSDLYSQQTARGTHTTCRQNTHIKYN